MRGVGPTQTGRRTRAGTNSRSQYDSRNTACGIVTSPGNVSDEGEPWYKRPGPLAIVVLGLTFLLNVIFF